MTGLQQLMHDALDQHPTDVVELAARARTRGVTLRRRHRLVTAGSSMAAFVVLVGAATGGSMLFGHGRQVAGSHVVAGSGGRQPLTMVDAVFGAVARANGSKVHADWSPSEAPSSTRAASDLKSAVTAVAIGSDPTARGLRAASTARHPAMVGADLSLGTVIRPVGQVLMTTESAAEFGGVAAMNAHVKHCQPGLQNCRVFTLLDGSRVRTYELHAGKAADDVGRIRVAEQLHDGAVTSLASYAQRSPRASVLSPWMLSTTQLVQVLSKLDHLS